MPRARWGVDPLGHFHAHARMWTTVHWLAMGAAQAVWLYVCILWGLLLALRHPRDPNFGHRLGPLYAWGVFKLGGIRLRVEHGERLRAHAPSLFIANHQSFLDVAICCALCPPRSVVLVKRSFLWVPLLGAMWWLSNQIFIERYDRTKARAAIDEATRRIVTDKVQLWMMPEGTRNAHGHTLLPFKRGAFHVAISARVPIVPIVVAPIDYVVDRKHWVWLGGDLHVKVLEPIDTSTYTEADAGTLADQTQARMQTELTAMTQMYYAAKKAQ